MKLFASGSRSRRNLHASTRSHRVSSAGSRFPKIKKFRRIITLAAIVALLAGIPVGISLLRHPGAASAAWFDMNWGFRTRYPLSNSTGSDQTNWQTQLSVDTATMVTASKLQSSCADIRITDAGGKSLPFWIEPTTCNTSATKIWVKVPSIPTGGANVYLYYGNPSATAATWTTGDVFIKDMTGTAAAWALDDTTTTQSYSNVVNPAVSAGRNIAINGTFDTDTIWTKGTGWTISSGTANASITGAQNLVQPSILTIGKAYTVTLTVSNRSAGDVYLSLGTAAVLPNSGAVINTNGTYTVTGVAAGNTSFIIVGENNFAGSVDNVIVTELNIPASPAVAATTIVADGTMEAAGTSSWTAVNSATLSKQTGTPHGGSQVLRIARNAVNNPGANQAILTAGVPTRITGYARSDGSATPFIQISSNGTIWTGTISTAWQPFDVVVVPLVTGNFQIQATTSTGTQYVEFDDVTVTTDTSIRTGELAQDTGFETWTNSTTLANWTKTIAGTSTVNQETSVTHGGSNAVRLDIDSSNSNAQITQLMLSAGKTYTVSFWAKSDAASGVSMSVTTSASGNLLLPSLTTTYTLYSVTFVAGDTGLVLKRNSAASHSIYIDDITVTEVSPLVGVPTNGVTLGTAVGSGGHLTTGYTFDGTNDVVNIYSGSLNSALNATEGSIVAWAKVSGSGVWTDGVQRKIVTILADTSNRFDLYKQTTNNTIILSQVHGGTTSTVSTTSLGGSTSWFQVAITWNKAADQFKAYVNGAQIGTTQTGLGTWTGNLASTNTIIGSSTSSGANPWSGMINDVRLYTRALSPEEIAAQYNATTDRQAYTTSNYQGHELIRQYSDSVTVGSAATEETGSAPVAYYKFDEGTGTTVNDSSPYKNSATATGTTWQPESQCLFGKCLHFDGSTSYVNLGHPVQTQFGGTATFSISAWVRPTSLSPNKFIFTKYNSTVAAQYSLGLQSSKLTFSREVSPFNTVGATTFTTNKWYYVTATYDGTTARVYVNGVLDASQAIGSASNTTNAKNTDTLIGAYLSSSSPANFFSGDIDEVKVYNYTRSQAQVQTDYLQGASKIGSSAVVGTNQAWLTQGLVGYWKMDESSWTNDCSTTSVTDSSGNANNAKACPNSTGPTGGSTTAKFSYAGSFDGSDDYVAAADATSLDLSDEMTMSIWIKPTAISNNVIMGKWDNSGNQRAYIFYTSGSKLLFNSSTNGSGASNAITGNTTLSTTAWTHVVVTKAGTKVNMYVNGVLDGTGTLNVASSLFNSTAEFRIGKDYAGTIGSTFSGLMDDARVYNRALSSDEVRHLYEWAPGPAAYYKLDENYGTSAIDTSGNSNTSTLTNGPTWAEGKYGGGLSFDGSNDFVSIPNSANNDFNYNQDFTLGIWAKIPTAVQNNVSSTVNSLVEANSGGGMYSYTIRYTNTTDGTNPGKVRFARFDGSLNPTLITTNTYNDNQWHYYTYVKNGSTLSVYVDGKFDKSGTDTTTTTTTTGGPVYLGARNGSSPFTGQLDDFKIYNYARTPQQVVEDMNAGHPAGGSPIGSQIAFWRMNEGQGQTVNNSIANGGGVNGTLGTTTSVQSIDPVWQPKEACHSDRCLSFDGSSQYIAVGSVTPFQTTDKTVTFWAKPNGAISATRAVFSLSSASGNWYAGFASSNRMIFSHAVTAGSQQTTLSPISAVTSDQWHHYAYSMSTSGSNVTIKLYIDGKLNTNTTYATGASSTYGATAIIGSFTSIANFYAGFLDDLKVYNSALTDDQIRLDYNANAAVNFNTGTATESGKLIDGAGNPPVGEWNFDEHYGTTANDQSGNGNTGTLTSGPSWTAGKYGSAIKFDGSNDYVNIPDPSSGNLDFGTGNFTVSTWVKASSASSLGAIVTKKNNVGNNGVGYTLSFFSGLVIFKVPTGSVNKSASFTYPTDNKWHYIVGVRNDDTLSIYLDGALQGSGTGVSGVDTSNAEPLIIGSDSIFSSFLSGSVDQVKIYNYARTPAQIAYDYNRGRPIGLWRFNECQGTTLQDSIGSNQGTITIGATGTQTSAGTCSTSSTAWGNGATGKFSASLNLDGTDDYVPLTSFPLSSLYNSTGLSVAAWVKVSSFAGNNAIYSEGKSSSALSWLLFYVRTSQKLEFRTGDNSGNINQYTGSTSLNTGQWYHVVVTVNGTNTPTLYVNGNPETLSVSNTTFSSVLSGVNLSAIGAYARNTTANYFAGQIDDVRLYNYTLTAAQIKEMMNSDSTAQFAPTTGSP